MSRKFEKYQKNLSIVNNNGMDYVKSYSTLVGEIDYEQKTIIELGKWSATTTKHLNYASSCLGFELIQYDGSKKYDEVEHQNETPSNSFFDFMGLFLKLGDLSEQEQTLEQKVAYKEKIVFATMRNQIPNWEEPYDWNEITLEQKLERLEKLESVIQ
jgi:hypothetical protein